MAFHKKKKTGKEPVKTVEQLAIERRMAEREMAAGGRKEPEKKPDGKRERKRPSGTASIVLWAAGLLVIIFLAYGFSTMFCRALTVQDGAMEPTISSGDTCLINALAYRLHAPERGDLIVYRTGETGDEVFHVKRVIGLPGETVQIEDGHILINGERYAERTHFSAIIDAGIAAEPVTLADNEYFVLGDNRNGSQDSRYASVGNIAGTDIIGKLWIRIRPLSDFGFVS